MARPNQHSARRRRVSRPGEPRQPNTRLAPAAAANCRRACELAGRRASKRRGCRCSLFVTPRRCISNQILSFLLLSLLFFSSLGSSKCAPESPPTTAAAVVVVVGERSLTLSGRRRHRKVGPSQQQKFGKSSPAPGSPYLGADGNAADFSRIARRRRR